MGEAGPEGRTLPFEMAGQVKLFKSGLMGHAVTVWSSYKGKWGPTQLFRTPEEPVVIRLASEDLNDQLGFAGGFIKGYVESTGGDLRDLEIWLQSEAVDDEDEE